MNQDQQVMLFTLVVTAFTFFLLGRAVQVLLESRERERAKKLREYQDLSRAIKKLSQEKSSAGDSLEPIRFSEIHVSHPVQSRVSDNFTDIRVHRCLECDLRTDNPNGAGLLKLPCLATFDPNRRNK